MLNRISNSVLATLLTVLTSTAALPGGVTAQDGELREGRAVTASLAAGDTLRYTIDVDDDFFVFGELDQVSVDARLRILDSDGTPFGTFNGGVTDIVRFSRQFATGGMYTIEVAAVDEAEGDFRLVLHRLEALETNPRRLADQLMSPYDGPDSPGAAVQVWRDGRTLFSKAYGMANLAYDIPFETDTRTNIGSTSKQFTAFAVMLQAERGLLSLDDDIRTHVPELPEFDETITVRHLLTHTSGLREFLNLLVMTGRRLDRGDWIGRDELIDIVQRQPALQNEPGAEWNYNNTAFGLAATIVERTSGQDFHVFMQENVFGPLGMDRTMVRPSPAHIVPEMSEGYTPGDHGFLQIGDLGGAVGAGGIYSTVEDLQTWVANYADPVVGSAEIFDEMMTSYVLNDATETGYGYGLGVGEHRGLRRVSHNGADVAHRSNLMFFPEINAGITVQSNHAAFNSGVATQLAEAFFADAMDVDEGDAAVAGEFDPESYDPEDFDDFVGRYALDAAPDFILTFTREDETLYTQATGQQRIEIVPTSDTSFALTVVDASVVFHRNDDGEVDSATLLQNGVNRATRLDDEEAAETWEPDADDLEAFAGTYFSEELETFYTVTLEDDALAVKQRRLDSATLTPGETDSFSGGGLSFAFERDRNEQVIGFYVSNGRTRDVRFERIR